MKPSERIIQIKKDLIKKLDGDDFKQDMTIDEYLLFRTTIVSREVAAIVQYLDEDHEKNRTTSDYLHG